MTFINWHSRKVTQTVNMFWKSARNALSLSARRRLYLISLVENDLVFIYLCCRNNIQTNLFFTLLKSPCHRLDLDQRPCLFVLSSPLYYYKQTELWSSGPYYIKLFALDTWLKIMKHTSTWLKIMKMTLFIQPLCTDLFTSISQVINLSRAKLFM